MSRIPRNALLAGAALLVFVAVAVAVDLQILFQARSTQSVWAVTRPVNAGDQLTSDNVRRVQIPQTGNYDVYLGGSVRPKVDLSVDGKHVSTVRGFLNNFGEYVSF